MNRSSIDWPTKGGPLWTWNPISGCRRGCPYCYAAVMHRRFYKTPFSDIVVHEERFNDPGLRVKEPRTIFVGSITDIDYWPKAAIERILEICERYSWQTFMFLSKNPTSYVYKSWPMNTMQGLTLTGLESEGAQHNTLMQIMACPRPYISFEPLIGTLKIQIGSAFEWVIVGAMTGPIAVKPKKEWIDSICDNVAPNRIYWKKSMKKIL